MKTASTLAAVLALLMPVVPALAASGFPRGWGGSVAHADEYEVGTAPVKGAVGRQAAYIKAKPGAVTGTFFSMTQCITPQMYLGKRLRLSARLRTVSASGEQLWMRVDGPPPAKGQAPTVLGFYNMSDAPITGTTDWQRRDVVLDVPPESALICFGFFLAGGQGEAWADGLDLTIVGKDVPVSRMVIPKAPVNLGFDR